ncbi:MAG: hypothetical protein ACTSRS_06570 [Candidatus Helarchaeota archaeon]
MFVCFMIIFMIKNIERDKWKNEKYQITNKGIVKKMTFSFFLTGRTESEQRISTDEFLQYEIKMSPSDRLFKKDTYFVSFFSEFSSFPKLYFSHVPEGYKIKEVLDSLVGQKRKAELLRRNQSPMSSIEWTQEFDSRANILVTLVKIALIWLIFLGIYYGFRALFLIIETDFSSIDFIYLFYFAIPISTILSLYFLNTFFRNAFARFSINNIGVYRHDTFNYLFELRNLAQFVMKPSLIGKLFRRDALTIYLYPDLSGKRAFRIPYVKNYEKLRTQLLDVLLLKGGTKFYDELVELREAPPIDIHVEDVTATLDIGPIEITAPDLQFIYSYLSPQEKVLKIFQPNSAAIKKNVLFSFLFLLAPFFLIFIVFGIMMGTFMNEMMIIFLPILLIFVPIIACSFGSLIYTLYSLKRTSYILTSEKIIIRTKKKIEFIPLESIETISMTRRFFERRSKQNVATITLLTKQKQKVAFMKVPRYFLLNSVENAEKIKELIQKAKSYL